MNGWFHRWTQHRLVRRTLAKNEAAIEERLQVAASLLPLPAVDVIHLARTAVMCGRTARSDRTFGSLPLWSATLAVLVVVLSTVRVVHPPLSPPVAAEVGEPVVQLVNGAVTWVDRMLGGKMLDDEWRLLIHDAERLSSVVVGDMVALVPDSPLSRHRPQGEDGS